MSMFSAYKFLAKNYWLLFGLIAYFLTTLSSLIRAVDSANSFGMNLYVIIDWIAATIPYFFLGALVGYLVDIYKNRNKFSLRQVPLWFWLTILMWVACSFVSFIQPSHEQTGWVLGAIFPLAYGIFFVGASYVSTIPSILTRTLTGKVLFDVLLLLVFLAWIVYAKRTKKTSIYYSLTTILFYVLVEGAILSAILFTN